MNVAYHFHDCNHHSHVEMHHRLLVVSCPMHFYYNCCPHCLENNCMIADRMMDQTFLLNIERSRCVKLNAKQRVHKREILAFHFNLSSFEAIKKNIKSIDI